MKYLKTLGLTAVVAAVLLGLPGSASANPSCITSPFGTCYTASFHASSSHVVWHDAVTTYTCRSMTIGFKIERHKGSATSTTAGGNVSTFTFGECNYPITVLKKGSLAINAAGTTFSTGAEITVHGPFGVNCIYTTNNTDIGTLTGGTPAKLDINSAAIPRTGHSAFCGASGTWTGSYTVTTPGTTFVS